MKCLLLPVTIHLRTIRLYDCPSYLLSELQAAMPRADLGQGGTSGEEAPRTPRSASVLDGSARS